MPAERGERMMSGTARPTCQIMVRTKVDLNEKDGPQQVLSRMRFSLEKDFVFDLDFRSSNVILFKPSPKIPRNSPKLL